jgi:hypothetical protein
MTFLCVSHYRRIERLYTKLIRFVRLRTIEIPPLLTFIVVLLVNALITVYCKLLYKLTVCFILLFPCSFCVFLISFVCMSPLLLCNTIRRVEQKFMTRKVSITNFNEVNILRENGVCLHAFWMLSVMETQVHGRLAL